MIRETATYHVGYLIPLLVLFGYGCTEVRSMDPLKEEAEIGNRRGQETWLDPA